MEEAIKALAEAVTVEVTKTVREKLAGTSPEDANEAKKDMPLSPSRSWSSRRSSACGLMSIKCGFRRRRNPWRC